MPVEQQNMPPGPLRRASVFLVKAVVSIVLLAVLLSRVDTGQLWTGARTASIPWLLVALALYGVLVFGRAPTAGALVKFRFYGPGDVLQASRDLRARAADQGLFARMPRSFYRDRPGRWRLTVIVGKQSKTWRFRIR